MRNNRAILYILMGLLILTAAAYLPARGLAKGNYSPAAQQIDYGNCILLYAVQPGDSLEEIADLAGMTDAMLLAQNDLDSDDDIFTGMVLCLETDGDGYLPPGERSGVEVIDVSVDQAVTVRGVNFPAEASLNVYLFQRGVSNPDIIEMDPITIPASGEFTRSYQIPEDLRAFRNLIIRFRNPDENISASATFVNADVERITPDECAEYYTVRSGDFLSTIAQDYDVSVERLVEVNNLIDANLVLPGQMLCLEVE